MTTRQHIHVRHAAYRAARSSFRRVPSLVQADSDSDGEDRPTGASVTISPLGCCAVPGAG